MATKWYPQPEVSEGALGVPDSFQQQRPTLHGVRFAWLDDRLMKPYHEMQHPVRTASMVLTIEQIKGGTRYIISGNQPNKGSVQGSFFGKQYSYG